MYLFRLAKFRPADDPEFCRGCFARAQEQVLAMQNLQEGGARQVVSVDEAMAAYYKLRDVRRGLDGLGQIFIGPALSVLLPVFALLFAAADVCGGAPRLVAGYFCIYQEERRVSGGLGQLPRGPFVVLCTSVTLRF